MALFQVRSVEIKTIPHNSQRYDTVGDYLWDAEAGKITIFVSDMGDWRYNLACAIHELIESCLLIQAGVDEPIVAEFDVAYEKRRQFVLDPDAMRIKSVDVASKHIEMEPRSPDELASAVLGAVAYGCSCIPTADSEPGEDRHAPYRAQHAFADGVERLFINEIGAVWAEYNDTVFGMEWKPGIGGM